MDEEDADVVIAAICFMLSCSAQMAITAMRKEHKSRRSTWVSAVFGKAKRVQCAHGITARLLTTDWLSH